MHTTNVVRRLAIAALGPLAAGAVMVAGAGSVSAPQPASLTTPLSGSTGATAAAVLTSTSTPTSVLQWPDTWKPGTAVAGTPCSNVALGEGSTTTRTIQAMGSQRRCV